MTKSASPESVAVGEELTYTVVGTNDGPGKVTGVQVTDALPSGVTVKSTSATKGSCGGTSTVTCSIGTLKANESATITIKVLPRTEGTITNTATIESNQHDPEPANNEASATTTVTSSPDPGGEVTRVTPEQVAGWSLESEQSASVELREVEEGLASPPLGTGALFFHQGDAGTVARARHTILDGTRVEDITRLEYADYDSDVATNLCARPVHLLLDVDPTGTGAPPAHVLESVLGQPDCSSWLAGWGSWDAREGLWRCDCITEANLLTLDDYLKSHPNATVESRLLEDTEMIVAGVGGGGGGLHVAVGPPRFRGGVVAPTVVESYADAVTVQVDDGAPVTFDFEGPQSR